MLEQKNNMPKKNLHLQGKFLHVNAIYHLYTACEWPGASHEPIHTCIWRYMKEALLRLRSGMDEELPQCAPGVCHTAIKASQIP